MTPSSQPDNLNNAESDANANFGFDDVGSTVQPCSGSTPPPTVVSPDKKHWIEIALMDQDGNPVAGESYSITLPDGSVQSGDLNDKGRARVEGIDPGTCKVTFPKLHKDSWH